LRVVIFMAVVLNMSADPKAVEQTGVLYRVSCTVVRFYVARPAALTAEPAR
jgi:hypothetical protein